jgi:hypothetical protein
MLAYCAMSSASCASFWTEKSSPVSSTCSPMRVPFSVASLCAAAGSLAGGYDKKTQLQLSPCVRQRKF